MLGISEKTILQVMNIYDHVMNAEDGARQRRRLFFYRLQTQSIGYLLKRHTSKPSFTFRRIHWKSKGLH